MRPRCGTEPPKTRQKAAVKKGRVMTEFLGRHPRTGRVVLLACFVVSFALASGAGKKWH